MKHKTQKHGFTLIELVLSLAILATLAALAVPLLGSDESLQVNVTRQLLVSDIEYAQIIAISHPEDEIDKVTSPKGCTIAGLNEMEHNGFSSAFIKGITVSAEKAKDLY